MKWRLKKSAAVATESVYSTYSTVLCCCTGGTAYTVYSVLQYISLSVYSTAVREREFFLLCTSTAVRTVPYTYIRVRYVHSTVYDTELLSASSHTVYSVFCIPVVQYCVLHVLYCTVEPHNSYILYCSL